MSTRIAAIDLVATNHQGGSETRTEMRNRRRERAGRSITETRNSWKKTNEQTRSALACHNKSAATTTSINNCHQSIIYPTIRVCPLRREDEHETSRHNKNDRHKYDENEQPMNDDSRRWSSRDLINYNCKSSPFSMSANYDYDDDETEGHQSSGLLSPDHQSRYSTATRLRRENVISLNLNSTSRREHAQCEGENKCNKFKRKRAKIGQISTGGCKSTQTRCHPIINYNYYCSSFITTILLSTIAVVTLSLLSTNKLDAYQLTNNLIANNLPPKFITTTTPGSSSSAGHSSSNGQQQQQHSNSEIVVRVKEGPQSIGKLICTLKGEDPDDDPLTFGVLGSMASDLLRIENVPGNQANVYLKKELDRETTESHQVVITLTDGKLGRGNWITKSMLIIVEDVNDNYPVFGPHRTAISIREDSKAPLVIETIEASDADEGRFGQVIYRLDNDEFHNAADESSSSSNSNAGKSALVPIGQIFSIETVDGKGVISLIGQLDYEQRPLYQLRIIAIDRAAEHERLMATTSILISVEDCEDQPPMFTFAPSITRIPEDLPIGTPIMRVAAIDGDRGVNNPIKYNILSVNNQESGPERNLFSIGTDSGQISVAHELDREASSSSAAAAMGDQQAGGSSSGWLSALTGGGATGQNSKSVAGANQPGGAYVLLVQAIEVNSEQNGAAADQSIASNSVTTELTVILTDVNDEAPTFNQPTYFGELLENSPAESLVTFIPSPPTAANNQQDQQLLPTLARVFDRDQGRNGTFTLHLEGEHAHLFDVWPREATNEATLMIKVSPSSGNQNQLKYFDYERTKELHFYLVAREKFPSIHQQQRQDQSSIGAEHQHRASSRAKMVVYLRDANDNYPQFDSELYRVEIPENAIRGMHICAVKATDSDSNSYGSAGIRYTEIRGEMANKFKLDPSTGIITLRTNEHGFDRETIPQHHLIVEARDSNGLGNRNTTQLLIVLTDVNDQRPKFLLDQYEAFIYENELDFQNPLQVQAVDNDAPSSMNSRIVYSIAGGDPQQNFTIDPQTGRIRVRATLVAPPTSSSSVHQNHSTTRQSHSFESSGGESDIVIGGQQPLVHQPLQATGLDFERIAQKRDDTRQFNLTVRATDLGLPEPLWDTTNVIISVYDKNDHAPVFTRNVYSRTIREDAKEGSSVVQVLAQDGDHSPINSRITYRISSGSSDKFSIDSETGLISVAHGANLDIDQLINGQKRTSYLLNVVAFDGSFGPNQKSASCLVNITILDVNNKAPEFVSLGGTLAGGGGGGSNNNRHLAATTTTTTFAPQHQQQQQQQHLSASVFVNEDAPYGLIVTRVIAVDLDSTADLRYSINWARSEARNEEMALVEPSLFRDCLSIDAADGTIKVAKQLDRELFDQIKLRLQVEDIAAQTSDQLAHTYLIVKITDINDNRPAFKRALYKAVVNENSISGTSVITLSADDRDLNKTIRYSLEQQAASNPNSLLHLDATRLVRINPKTGEITVNDKIDRELYPMINVTVKAEDFGYPRSLVGTTQLVITVRDENDNNPIFLNSTHLRPPQAAPSEDGRGEQSTPRNHNMVSSGQSTYRSRSLGPPLQAAAAARSYAGPDLDDLAVGGDHHLSPPQQPAALNLPLLAPGSSVKVREDSPVGHQLAFVRAEDADLGNNGRVTYLLDSSSSGGKFRIERDSGVISVAQQLDREQQKLFTLIIEACDNYDLGYSTGESRRAFTQVHIQITDVNDNVPIVRTNLQVHQNNLQLSASGAASMAPDNTQLHKPAVDSLLSLAAHDHDHRPTYDEAMQSPGPYELPLTECLFINEFQPLNEPILTLFASDADDPDTPNGQVNLAILNNLPQNELFGLVSTTSNNKKRSTSSTLSTASEGADLTGFGDLLGGESSGRHVSSIQKRSTRDAREESRLEPGNFYSPATQSAAAQYHRLGGGGGGGAASSMNGQQLPGGRQQSPASIGRSISTIPASSAALLFDSIVEQPTTMAQPESPTTTTTTTSDPEMPTTSSSMNGDSNQQQQAAHHLVVLQPLKERVGNYTILVRATDLGQPALSSIKSINVCVQDVNNHAPVFVRPPPADASTTQAIANHTLRIMENSTVGSFVTQVEATDLDYGLNGRIQYSLKPTNFIHNQQQQQQQHQNNDWQSFKIDRFTGVITTAKQFNRQLKKYYTLRVQAQDFGRPTSLSSDIDLNIMIANSGKYQPEFDDNAQLQSLQFTENAAPGLEWFTLVQTSNLDDDPALISLDSLAKPTTSGAAHPNPNNNNNNWLASPCYYIIEGDDDEQVFQLDRYTHRLTNQKVLDREKKANYTLLVQASNSCNKPPPSLASPQTGNDAGLRVRRSLPLVAHNASKAMTEDQQLPAAQSMMNNNRLANIDQWVANDKSLLKVVIKIKDLNDNAPRFTQRIYTGGITTEADFGTVFMIAQAIDLDADLNGQVSYSIIKPIKRHLASSSSVAPLRRSGHASPVQATATTTTSAPTTTTTKRRLKRNTATTMSTPTTTTGSSTLQIQFPYSASNNNNNENTVYSENELTIGGGASSSSSSMDDDAILELPMAPSDGDDLFAINAQTGELSLNFDPQKHMKGYFEFEIMARDLENLTDTARVLIYLLRQDQRVKFVLRLTPQELRQRLNKFRSVMGNITGAIVNIDSYKYYENHDGTVDKKKSSLFLHFVSPDDNTIIDVHKVLQLIDNNIEYLDELYKEFHVLSSEAAQLPLGAGSNGALVDPIDQVRTGLMGISSFLALILVLVIALCLNQRTRYERQLKAATVSAFGSSPLHIDPDFHSQTNLPNTNLHSQDPNPIWMNGVVGGGGGYSTSSDQVDWLANSGGGGNSASNQHQQGTRRGARHHQQQQQLTNSSAASGKMIHSASSGISGGMTLEMDDDLDAELSSTASSSSGGGGKRIAGQHLLHHHSYKANGGGNGTSTATPRDSLNSSHGQVSSAGSGSGSASTTNERQTLCKNNPQQQAKQQAASGGRQTPSQHLQQLHNHAHQLKKASRQSSHQQLNLEQHNLNGDNVATVTTGGSSTFGAMKEVTIYTDHHHHHQAQHNQHPAGVYATQQPVQSQTATKTTHNQATTNKQQQSIYVTNIKQTAMAAVAAAAVSANQNRQTRTIIVHGNGVDVDQGIIKNLNSSIQQKSINNLNAKFVPTTTTTNNNSNQQNFSNSTTTTANQKQQQQQQNASVQNFETSLSKLSILNLETTEL